MTIYQALNIKNFMNSLFKGNAFDDFYLREIKISTFAYFTINGLSPDTTNTAYAKWSAIRPYAYSIIKGSVKPSQIKIVFATDTDILPEASALFLNITYENDTINCITGTSTKDFMKAKTIDRAFNSYILDFFKQNNIPISTLD